jgi:hypothetical protein
MKPNGRHRAQPGDHSPSWWIEQPPGQTVAAVNDGVIVGSGRMGLTDGAAGLMWRQHRSWSIRLARARAWAARSQSTSSGNGGQDLEQSPNASARQAGHVEDKQWIASARDAARQHGGCTPSLKYRRQARVSAEPARDASPGLKVALLASVEGGTHLLQVGRAQGYPRVPEEMITQPQLDFGG